MLHIIIITWLHVTWIRTFFLRLKAEKRLKDQQRKQRVTENRKHLANVRVVQKNLVFVVGLPLRLADADVSLNENKLSETSHVSSI